MNVLIDLPERMLEHIEAFREAMRLEGKPLTRAGAIRLLLAESLGAREIIPEEVPRLRAVGLAYAETAVMRRRRSDAGRPRPRREP